jgi:hypothetical protein
LDTATSTAQAIVRKAGFCNDISADLTKKAPDTGLDVGEKLSKKPLFFSDF